MRVDVVLVPQRADIRQVRRALDQTLMVCKCYGQESQPTGILCTPAFDARGGTWSPTVIHQPHQSLSSLDGGGVIQRPEFGERLDQDCFAVATELTGI